MTDSANHAGAAPVAIAGAAGAAGSGHDGAGGAGWVAGTGGGAPLDLAGSAGQGGSAGALSPTSRLFLYAQSGSTLQAFSVDRQSGSSAALGAPVEVCRDPIHLQVSAAQDQLLAACVADGGLAVLAIDPTTGTLSLKGFAEGGGDAVFVSVHPSGQFAVTADYGDVEAVGYVTLYRVDGEGTPSRIESLPAASKMHSARFSPDGHHVYAASQGDNAILQYRFDEAAASLQALDPASVPAITTEGGAGEPRHVLPSEDGRTLYVTGQNPAVLLTFDVDPETGALSKKEQGIPLFDAPQPDAGTGKDLVQAPGRRFLYTSAWQIDRISTFTLAENGGPSRISVVESRANSAQGLAIDPEGSLLFAAHDGEPSGVAIFSLSSNEPAYRSSTGSLVGQGVATVSLPNLQ